MTAPSPIRDRMVWPLLERLRTSLATQFGAAARPVREFGITAGGEWPPADYCDCGDTTEGHGQAWVKWVNQRSVDTNPPATGCPTRWAVTVQLGVYRCWPSLDDEGNPPPTDAVTAAARGVADDAAALRRAVKCCEVINRLDIPWLVDRTDQIGPSGGCIGVAITIRFHLEDCDTCPPDGAG
jgi:hypothetical protein